MRLKLYKGNIITLGRRSAVSLYRADVASMDEAGGYNQADAGGFIRLQGLRYGHGRRRRPARRSCARATSSWAERERGEGGGSEEYMDWPQKPDNPHCASPEFKVR